MTPSRWQPIFNAVIISLLGTTVHARSLLVTRANINSCLNGLNVSFPGDPSFQPESAAFNQRLSYTPAAIVLPGSVADVETAVTCGATLNVSVVARSGGHSYAAYGLGGKDGSLVLDLSAMKNISIDGSNAIVQTGNRLGEVAEYLWNNGQLALPHGTCPTVGTGGHTSYGGYGPYSRMAGLLLDRVVSAEVVLANGTSVTASNTTNSDLFWALKGAAPSYGIVTSWTYLTTPAPSTTTFFSISLPAYTTGSTFASAFSQYQTFVHTAPKELAMAFSLGANGSGGINVQLIGNYFGSKSDFTNLVNSLVQGLGGSITNATEYTDWTQLQVANAYGEALIPTGPETPDTFFAKSLMIDNPLDNSSLTSWGNYLMNTAASTDINWFAQADLYAGAISDFAASSSSYAHRDAFIVFQLYGSSNNNAPFPSDGINVINNMLNSITANPTAAYPNYIDPTLTAQQWQSLYFGDNLLRLSGIKAVYDPNNVFSFPQSIPVGETSAATITTNPTGTETNNNHTTESGSSSSATPNTRGSSLGFSIAIGLMVLGLSSF